MKLNYSVLTLYALLYLPSTALYAKPISDKLFNQVRMCESSNRQHVWGDDNTSYGILQFIRPTFKRLAKKARPHLIATNLISTDTQLKWGNTSHQLLVGRWAMDNGWGHEWTCFRKITGTGRPKKLIVSNFEPMD